MIPIHGWILRNSNINEHIASRTRDANEPNEGFTGEFSNLKLTDLIQMGTQGGMSLVLHVTQGQKDGRIYMQDGEIIHAVCGDISGVEAFYEIMSWKKGQFRAESYVSPPTQSITLPWEHLLIEAHRWLDEREALLNQVTGDFTGSVIFLKEISEILEEWGKSHEEVIEIGLITPDGMVTIFNREERLPSLKALEILRVEAKLSHLMSRALACGSCQEVVLAGGSASVALFFLDSRVQVYAFIEANIYQKAILRMEMTSLNKKLGEIIKNYHKEV